MIVPARLLSDLKSLLRVLEDGIRDDLPGTPADAHLRAEWQAARDAARTAATYESWREEEITQAAVHWVLACVFLRFAEDNGLVERPWLAGPDETRMALARDRHEAYFRANPVQSDRDYLRACFEDAATLPGMSGLFDPRHNPVWRLDLSGEGGMRLREFWQRRDPDSGLLTHDFTDADLETRFLGDLYQDLSEAAQEKFALLQTPEFVEEFILGRTLEPAISEFGFRAVRLIDPTCGSGHFLIGAFRRLAAHWQRQEPDTLPREVVQKALAQVAGVDLNPFAVEITRFRLLVEALRAAGVNRLDGAPDFRFELAAGDSLLHGTRFMRSGRGVQLDLEPTRGLNHVFESEDGADLTRILGRQYHAVVGNPPYITVKDKALNQAYRDLYDTCHGKYSLGVPFTERFFDLALAGNGTGAGFVGLITANSFMKREFGKKLIESYLPKLDLTHVINTDGAYIPGHNTPTVILYGRNRRPATGDVRAVMTIRGEPSTPAVPGRGLVWAAILAQVDQPGSQGDFVSVEDISRASLAIHPWSMGGGGASDLKETIEAVATHRLADLCASSGVMAVTGEDDLYTRPSFSACVRSGIPTDLIRPIVSGDNVRDWLTATREQAIFEYRHGGDHDHRLPPYILWPFRSVLAAGVYFGKRKRERGMHWAEYAVVIKERLSYDRIITFGEVATHNHFVLDRGGKVFKQAAPVIKLPADATEDDHLRLLGLLNSSTACFWLKQSCHNKGASTDSKGARQRTDAFEDFYQVNSKRVVQLPLADPPPLDLAQRLDALAQELAATAPAVLLAAGGTTRADLDTARARAAGLRRRMVALQEELDWRCYRLYGLVTAEQAEGLEWPADRLDDLPEIDLGQRAFEVSMARAMASGDLETTWFARHGSTPITDLPAHWPDDYRALVDRRLARMADTPALALVERPEYKRRWQGTAWEVQEQDALRDWLLDRLEDARLWGGRQADAPHLLSTNQMADIAGRDDDFVRAAELYTGEAHPDLAPLVRTLVLDSAVPHLPGQRYKATGLRKRAQWEEVWDLQRAEDAGQDVGDIPVPPKYKAADFRKTTYWRLRNGLDVPKERFVLYPHCDRGADGSPMVAWAGYDPLRQAHALAALYQDMMDNEGWETPRLLHLLAGVRELLPWLKQWHNTVDPAMGLGMGDYFQTFVEEESRRHGTTLDGLADVAKGG